MAYEIRMDVHVYTSDIPQTHLEVKQLTMELNDGKIVTIKGIASGFQSHGKEVIMSSYTDNIALVKEPETGKETKTAIEPILKTKNIKKISSIMVYTIDKKITIEKIRRVTFKIPNIFDGDYDIVCAPEDACYGTAIIMP